ncbi:MAG: glycosyltransferase family 4 protein [Merismopedia sp. SIO2A8]|nr:glycosyltransferase family 4 protein [Merismopedia sp. SIO2A8]
MHYAVPRLLYQTGLLDHFYTDICAVKGWPRLLNLLPPSLQPSGVRRLLGRVPQGIPPQHITAFNRLGWSYAKRLRQAHTAAERTAAFLWSGERFCQLVLQQGLTSSAGIYTFNSAGLEIMQTARQRGIRTVVEQTIVPRAVEYQLLKTEHDKFPGWEVPISEHSCLQDYIAREQAEWNAADMILCGSTFVKQGIATCGGPAERAYVVPYGIDYPPTRLHRPAHGGPLRVLTVGGVGLRKGSPYLLEAAKQLKGRAIFRLVGSIDGLLEPTKVELACHTELMGSVPRSTILDHYQWADVFLLPSICEGSATVVYEALTTGLPVICTTNTGSVVRDGVDGFIVPIRDTEAIATHLKQLATDPDLRLTMGKNAYQRAESFTLEQYRQRLVNCLTQQI